MDEPDTESDGNDWAGALVLQSHHETDRSSDEDWAQAAASATGNSIGAEDGAADESEGEDFAAVNRLEIVAHAAIAPQIEENKRRRC